MRLHFPNLTRPKKSAKLVATKLKLSLSSAQKAVARISGYEDWHDLEINHSRAAPSTLDQHISRYEFVTRQVDLSLALSKELSIPDGDAQHVLASARLTGDRSTLLSDQIEIRIGCLRQTVLPIRTKRERGAIGKIKAHGWNGTKSVLRSFGRPTTLITHKNVTTVGDFEFVLPRNPEPLFLPMRLYLPYGYWIEGDGAKVLFSRDYMPMWRVRDDAEPERLEPWTRIKFHDEGWVWDGEAPWDSGPQKDIAEAFLAHQGVNTLPIWADAFPLLVLDDELDQFSEAVGPLKESRM